jgi:hypothetical protein
MDEIKTRPGIVYKYLPVARLTYLDDELLRFTQPAALNDPFECYPKLTVEDAHRMRVEETAKHGKAFVQDMSVSRNERRINRRVLRRVRETQTLRDTEQKLDGYWQTFHTRQNAEVGILSLSSRPGSTLMWSHYSDSHQGFCVGFKRDHEFFQGNPRDPRNVLTPRPVTYADERFQYPTSEGEELGVDHIFTKCKDWEYEAEHRMVLRLSTADQIKAEKPFPIHLFRVPHSAVSEIIIGARAPTAVIDTVADFAKRNGVTLRQAQPSRTSFEIELLHKRTP